MRLSGAENIFLKTIPDPSYKDVRCSNAVLNGEAVSATLRSVDSGLV
jgi:hypothetical protein